jgi:gliding motility-associated-like protein
MNQYHSKLILIIKFLLISYLIITPFQDANSQNFVVSGGELAIVGSIDLSTSTVWETNKSSNPGFFTWVNSSDNYESSSDLFHINGYVKKIGNQGFVFPVGDGLDLRTLQMSAPSTITSEYAVAWLSGSPDVTPDPTNLNQLHTTSSFLGAIKAVSPVGQWDWLPVNGTGEGLTITVSIPALTGDFFTSASDVRLVGWDGNAWINLGTSGASALSENSTLSGTMIAGIQAIGIGSVKTAVAIVQPPTLVVEQNTDGSLKVQGTATAGNSVLITFPDNSTVTAIANSQGVFGPVSSVLPQVLKSFVTAVATNTSGVSSSAVIVNYEFQPKVYISEAFTPNGDGINDTWVIYQLENFPNTTVRVYNRLGLEVFSAKDYKNDWDGHFNDSISVLPTSGSYYYQIDYGSNGTIDKQGWLYLRR